MLPRQSKLIKVQFNPAHFHGKWKSSRYARLKNDLDLGIDTLCPDTCIPIDYASNSKLILPLKVSVLTRSATCKAPLNTQNRSDLCRQLSVGLECAADLAGTNTHRQTARQAGLAAMEKGSM